MLLRGTRCPYTCCLGRWTPVSTRPSLCVLQRTVCWMDSSLIVQYCVACSNTRPSGGRVPSSEWRQSRSCSFSASGNTLLSSVCVCNQFSVSALIVLYVLCFQPVVVQDMTEFKRSLPLFPLAKPHINFMAAKLWSHHLQSTAGFDWDTQHPWV